MQQPVPARLRQFVQGIAPQKDIDALTEASSRQVCATAEGIWRVVQPFTHDAPSIAVVGAHRFVGRGVVSRLAVAAGLVPLATGNDGAGSLRIPAAWCGVLGVKTTNGLLPSVNALNAPGPLARTVADATSYLDAILGTRLAEHLAAPPRGQPIQAVWSVDLGCAEVDQQIAGIAHAAANRLADDGFLQWVEHDLVLNDPEPVWKELRTRTSTGKIYSKETRMHNNHQLAKLFSAADILVTPTTPYTAHGHAGPGKRLNVALTWAFNVSGHPAASIPAGFAPDNTPVGFQIVAQHNREDLLMRTAAALQRIQPWPSPYEEYAQRAPQFLNDL